MSAKTSLLPIQMLWVGDSLSRLEYLCMQSFIANGHEVHLYCYTRPANTPAAVTIKDANSIIDAKHIFKHQNSYACFADLFRWKLLATCGGFYADTDMLCIKPLDFSEPAIIGYESHAHINTAIIKLPAEHPLALELLDCALHPLKLKPYDTRRARRKKILNKFNGNIKALYWGETAGPVAVSNALAYMRKNKLDNFDLEIKDFRYFYPVHYSNWQALVDTTLADEQLYSATYCVHLWNEMLRRYNIDKNQPFAENSFLGKYFAKYCNNYPEV